MSDNPRPAAEEPLVDDAMADQLLAKAEAEGVELLGPDGLLSQVTEAVLERALGEELTEHLGYEKHDPAGRGSGKRLPVVFIGALVRHEAPCDRVEVKDLHHLAVAAAGLKLRAARSGERRGGWGSPDNDGMRQHCHMVRVRLVL